MDLTAYWPSDWLKSTKPRPSPYFPQVGDIVSTCTGVLWITTGLSLFLSGGVLPTGTRAVS